MEGEYSDESGKGKTVGCKHVNAVLGVFVTEISDDGDYKDCADETGGH